MRRISALLLFADIFCRYASARGNAFSKTSSRAALQLGYQKFLRRVTSSPHQMSLAGSEHFVLLRRPSPSLRPWDVSKRSMSPPSLYDLR